MKMSRTDVKFCKFFLDQIKKIFVNFFLHSVLKNNHRKNDPEMVDGNKCRQLLLDFLTKLTGSK